MQVLTQADLKKMPVSFVANSHLTLYTAGYDKQGKPSTYLILLP